jgi:hypothetical protein
MSTENSPEQSVPDVDPDSIIELDPIFQSQIDRLHQLNIYGRWVTIGLLWATVGAYSLWELRYPIELISEDFTWSAVKYGLSFQPLPALGLSLCIGIMSATLVWQSRNIIWGIPKHEQERLIKQVCRIRQQGSSHPLWKWVVTDNNI